MRLDMPPRRPAKPPVALLVLCFERTPNAFAGLRMASFINDWAIEERAQGREISVEDFAKTWSAGRRATAYTRLREFREAFPTLGPKGTPHQLGVEWPEGSPVFDLAEVRAT
jgi:hypothetical protein